jgi:hypothetical protein
MPKQSFVFSVAFCFFSPTKCQITWMAASVCAGWKGVGWGEREWERDRLRVLYCCRYCVLNCWFICSRGARHTSTRGCSLTSCTLPNRTPPPSSLSLSLSLSLFFTPKQIYSLTYTTGTTKKSRSVSLLWAPWLQCGSCHLRCTQSIANVNKSVHTTTTTVRRGAPSLNGGAKINGSKRSGPWNGALFERWPRRWKSGWRDWQTGGHSFFRVRSGGEEAGAVGEHLLTSLLSQS